MRKLSVQEFIRVYENPNKLLFFLIKIERHKFWRYRLFKLEKKTLPSVTSIISFM